MPPAPDPYLLAWRREQRNRRAVDGPLPGLAARLGPLLVAGLLVPLVRPSFFAFLDRGPDALAPGAEAVIQRAGIALVAWLALDLYTALIRNPDRAILDLLPVDPRKVAAHEIRKVAVGRLVAIPAFAILLSPLAFADPILWVLGMVAIVGTWLLAISVGSAVHLLAVGAAEDPRWAPLLDLLRGHNPREQAAFLYAPGVALAGAGALSLIAAKGATLARDGDPLGVALLLLPFPAAALAASQIPALADRAWMRAGTVLADIDARYAALEAREDARVVYLEWAVRFAPASLRPWLLRDLRCGWRAQRGFVTGAWIAGAGAALLAWSGDPGAPGRSAAAVAAAAWGVCAVGVLLDRHEPEFLRAWLPDGGAPRRAARVLALWGWAAACVPLAAVAAGLRHGADGAGLVALAGLTAVLPAGLAAALSGRLGPARSPAYLALAALASGAAVARFWG